MANRPCECGEAGVTVVFKSDTEAVVVCDLCIVKHQKACRHRWISHPGYPDKCWNCKKVSF